MNVWSLPITPWRRLFCLLAFILIVAMIVLPARATSDAVSTMRLFDAALAKANSQADAFLAPKHLAEAAQLYGLAANELRNRREAQAIAYAQQGLKASRRNSRCLQSVMNQEI